MSKRNKQYVEDSTKGKAMVNPKTYKRDVHVQFSADSRILAMLSDWLDREDEITRHLSEVIYRSLEIMVENLLDNGMIQKIEFCQDARDMLVRKYKVNLNNGGRYKRNVIHNLHLDERRRDRSIKVSDERPIVDHGMDDVVARATARALEIMEEKNKQDMQLLVDKEDIRERLRNSNSTKIVSNSRDSDVMSADDESHQEQVQEQNQSVQSHQIRKLTEEELDEVERRIAEKDRLLAEKTKTIPLNIKRV